MLVVLCCFFFFKQRTAYEMRISDWSSDVCSSDLDRRDEVLRSAGAVRFFFTRRAVRARTRAILLSAALVAFGGGAAAQDFDRAVHQIGRASCRDRVCQYV